MMGRGHLGYLDTFRALAIAGVVLTHSIWLVDSAPRWLDNIVHFGSKGVQLFFIVSGFTLAMNYDSDLIDLRSFYTKRFFRIAPMYYLTALVYVVLGLTLMPSIAPKNLSAVSWLTTFTFTNGWHPDTINSFVPGGWSIAAEMTFYALFPLLLRLKSKPILLLFVTIGSFGSSVIVYALLKRYASGSSDLISAFAYFFWIVQLPAFIAGICMAAWLPRIQRFTVLARITFPIAFAAMLAAAFTRGFTSSYIVADLIFIALVLSGALSNYRVLSNKAITYIGQVSFSVYLTHFLFVRLLQPITEPLSRQYGTVAVVLIGYVLVFVSAVALSSLTFPSIEMRGKAVGDQIVRLMRARASNIRRRCQG